MSTSFSLRSRRYSQGLVGLTVAVAALVAAGSPAYAQAPATPAAKAADAKPAARVLDRAQIDAFLAQPDKVLFLDVRRADEVSTLGGFPAYLSIQVAELEHSLANIPKGRKIVTVSNHAHRAVQAAAVLSSHGFQVVGAVGVLDYAAQGGQLVGKKPPASATSAPPAAPGA